MNQPAKQKEENLAVLLPWAIANAKSGDFVSYPQMERWHADQEGWVLQTSNVTFLGFIPEPNNPCVTIAWSARLDVIRGIAVKFTAAGQSAFVRQIDTELLLYFSQLGWSLAEFSGLPACKAVDKNGKETDIIPYLTVN